MPQHVDVGDGVLLEFPDEMSRDDIRTAIKTKYKLPTGDETDQGELAYAEKISDAAAQMKEGAIGSKYATRRAQLFDTAAKALDIPGAAKALINLPNRIAGLPDMPAVVSPEQATKAVQFFNPMAPSSVGSLQQGVEQGLGATVSGATEPENLAAMVLAKRFPMPVGTVFAGETIGGIPESTRRLTEAKTPAEAGRAAVGLAGNIAIPAAIGKGLRTETKGTKPNAREIQKAAEVHGDLRTQPVEGAGEVPVEKSVEGVQSQTEGGIQSPEEILAAAETRKGLPEKIAADVDSMTPEEFVKWKTDADATARRVAADPNKPHQPAYMLGEQSPNEAFVDQLKELADKWKKVGDEAIAKANKEPNLEKRIAIVTEAQPASQKGQFFREAWERARGVGSAVEGEPGFEAPFPEKKAAPPAAEPPKPAVTPEPLKANARLAYGRPIQEPYSDQHSMSLQINSTDLKGVSEADIRASLPKELQDKLVKVEKFKASIVPTDKRLSMPSRVKLVFPDKATAQAAIDHFKGAEPERPALPEPPNPPEPVAEQATEPAKAEGKQPWEMTKKEVMERTSRQLNSSGMVDVNATYLAGENHREIVRDALREGKPVPPEVLADYPDLAKPPAKAETAGKAKSAKPVAQMTAAEINKEMDRLSKESSAITDLFIAEGRGSERPSDYYKKTDPLSVRANTTASRMADLRGEIEARYGPKAPSRLPTRGFGPRDKPQPPSSPPSGQALGIVPPGTTMAQAMIDWVQNAPTKAKVLLAQLAGKSAPRTSTASQPSGNALVHYASAKIAAPTVARSMATEVLGDHHKDPVFGLKLGAVLVEDRLRAIQRGFTEAGDPTSAAAVTSILGKDWSPLKSEADFQTALRDPEIRAAIERHKATVQPMAEQAHEEARGNLAGPGLQTGAFVNLKAILEGLDERTGGGAGRGNLENPLRRLSKFFKQAKGTAGKYELDYRTLAERMVSGNFEEAAKRQMYNRLVQDGLAVINDPADGRPDIGGKPAYKNAFTIERRGVPAGDGRARTYIKKLWVRQDIGNEMRQAWNVDGQVAESGWTAAANLINKIQLAGPTDAVWHTANMLGSIAGSQGGRTLLIDLARKIPGVNIADAVGRTVQSGIRVLRDNPDVQRDLAQLAEIGALRGQHTAGPIGRAIQFVDKAGRLVRNDMFNNLVERGLVDDTEVNRREWVNQMGQYNGRLMGQFQRFFKEAGFSPFIVAGRNFNRMAMRRLTLDPGVKAASPAAAAQMRAIEAVGTIATLFAVPALINYWLNGNPNGRPGVKMGQIDTGKDDKDGKHIVIDPAQWTGLRRGLRISGAQAVVEGMRHHEGSKNITRTATHDILGGIMHPWTGPAVTAPVVGVTGYDPRFYKESVNPKDVGENVKAALKQLNPVANAILTSKEKETGTLTELGKSLGGAAGIKSVGGTSPIRQASELHQAWMRNSSDPKVRLDYERRQKEEFVSDYKDLDRALASGNEKAAIAAIKVLQETKKNDEIKRRMNPRRADGTRKTMFHETPKLERQFIDSLSPKEAELYDAAQEERKRNWEKFLDVWSRRD